MEGDLIFVRGLEFEANHGHTAAERRSTRRFRVGIRLATPLGRAAASDRLRDTIDYGRVCEIALRTATDATFKLLEALAGQIADALQSEYPGVGVEVELEKLSPPCPGVPASCGVVVTRASA